MTTWFWYVAWQQTKYYRKQTAIGIVGIGATILVLMVILSFSHGIQEFFAERILLLTPHLSVEGGRNELIEDIWQNTLLDMPGVLQSAPYLLFPGLVQKGLAYESVLFRGVDWALENSLFNLEEHLEEGDWSSLEKGLLIGAELGRRLGVSVGQTLSVITASKTEEIAIEGIFYTGYYPLDGGLVLLPLDTAQRLLGVPGLSGYGLKVEGFPEVDSYIHLLQDRTGLWVRPWYEKEQGLFITMQVQRVVLIWIMLFAMVVSSLGVMNIFILRSWEQRRNVGVFRSLGATPRQIAGLFLAQGLFCGLLGGAFGLLAARLIVLWLGRVAIYLPQVFYFERLPIRWAGNDLWWVLLLACASGLIAVLWPAWRLSRVEPGEVLRSA